MNTIHHVTTAIMDAVLTPFEMLGDELALILVSGIFGVLALLLFKQISWQKGIKAAKDRIKGHMIAIRLYQDDLAIVGKSVGSVMVRNVQYLGLNFLPILPLMAIPLAIDRVRGQRSYGLVVGLAMLIAYHQLLQLGEALADNDRIPSWAGLWLPYLAFAGISLTMFLRAARKVPDPRLGIWLDRQFDRLGRFLPRRRGVAASRG